MPRTLHSDAHVTITVDDATNLVRYIRSREPYASLEVLRAVNEDVRRTMNALPKGDLTLLIDVREAPPRNDEAFEKEIGASLQSLEKRFVARATLVKSAVGRLQVQRIARARDGHLGVFSDEAEAVAHLTNQK